MFATLYIREIQNFLYGLRFRVSFVIVLLVFVAGTVSYLSSSRNVQENYAKLTRMGQEVLSQRAQNVSKVATFPWNMHVTAPLPNSLVADCKEEQLPNMYRYNAFNVFEFMVRHDSANPLLKRSESLSWSFIVSMFLSFITLLLAFDSISGEKEDRTLSLIFSNPVPRRTFLCSKLLSIVSVVGGMMLVGILVSLLILTVSGQMVMSGMFLCETAGFILISLLFITTFAVFGLLSSAVTRYSNVSLLISLCFWLFSAVIIPNTSVFWAARLFPIPTSDEVAQAIHNEQEDIRKNAPEGSFSSNSSQPFYYRHELRANYQMNVMLAEKRHKDAYYQQMFGQFERTRQLTLLSPIAQFDYINEAFLGGGYLRFRKNWNDLHIFQEQFLQWFKDIDAKDAESPHWYNPIEDYSTSKKPVAVDQIPLYQEQVAPFGQRLQYIGGYLAIMVLTIAVLFMACFFFFTRYDVR